MKFQDILKDNSKNIDNKIENLLPKKWSSLPQKTFKESKWAYDVESINKAIMDPMWDLLDRGGKRWRPFLMKLMYEALGGQGSIDKFLPIVEVIHNGTIMIDDIEDNSDLRRGGPSTHNIYGIDLAVNTGNAMYFLPMLSIIEDDTLDLPTKNALYETVFEEMIKIHMGQGLDIFWHRGNKVPTENEYLQMCAFKTGTLARMAAKLGGILGHANKETINALGEFAESIGVAFQIQDDILNICPKENWGKDFGDDISEGKRTLMVIKSLENISNEDASDLINILNMKTKNKIIIKEAVNIIKSSGAIEYAKEVARNLVKDAWEKIDKILESSQAKNKLKMLSDFIVEREI